MVVKVLINIAIKKKLFYNMIATVCYGRPSGYGSCETFFLWCKYCMIPWILLEFSSLTYFNGSVFDAVNQEEIFR